MTHDANSDGKKVIWEYSEDDNAEPSMIGYNGTFRATVFEDGRCIIDDFTKIPFKTVFDGTFPSVIFAIGSATGIMERHAEDIRC